MNGGAIMKLATGGVISTKGTPDTGPGYTIKGVTDGHNPPRPVVFSKEAAEGFAKMMRDSGGIVKGSDIASSKRSPSKNTDVGGASRSKHLYGIGMDIHGSSKEWIKKNGSKYGWNWAPYGGPGDHGGHFTFGGPGLTPSGTSGGGDSKDTPDKDSEDTETKDSSETIDWSKITGYFKDLTGALRGTGSGGDSDSSTKEVKSTYPDRDKTKLEPSVTAPAKPNTAGTTLNQAQSQANAASRTQGGRTTTTVVNQPSTTHAGVTTTTGGSQFSTVHSSASPYITFPLSNT
jgi:hypothetical protein